MKKAFAIAAGAVVLLALSLIFVKPVDAQTQKGITINADGSITPTSALILRNGSYYALTAVLEGSLTINRSNLVLDGKGYSLIGGVSISDMSNVTVENCEVSDTFSQVEGSPLGISLTNTSNSVIANNSVAWLENIEAWNGGNYCGICIDGGSDNLVTGNNLTYNLVGVGLFSTSHNQVVANNIVSDPNFSGLYSQGIALSDANNNTIYHNDFVNNTYQVYSSGSVNRWDDGYPNGGNYWGDYWNQNPGAAEIGNSGILNMAYVIDKDNKDRYPLAEPFNGTLYALETVPPRVAIVSPLNQKYNQSSVPLVFNVNKAVSWMGYSLDGKPNVTVTGNTTIANVTSGSHTLIVYANDTFGDMGASQPITFTIPSPQSFPEAALAAIAVAAVAAAACLIACARKRKGES